MDEEEENIPPAIVIDNGSGYCKAGYSGEEFPCVVFQSIIGRPKIKNVLGKDEQEEYYVGTQPEDQKGKLNYSYPIKNGIIINWDDIEKIWDHCFKNELKVSPEEYNCMLSEGPLNPKNNREKICQIMFEKFNVPGLYIGIQAILSLYAAGKFTGLVCDSGDGITQFVPVFDGYSLPNSVIRLDFAGRDLTSFLGKILIESGVRITTSADFEIVKEIKESLCYVALDYENEKKTVKKESYKLPDGTIIQLSEQRIKCPECLFQPEIFDREIGGIGQKCYDCIQKSEIDLRKELYQNLIISGGSTMFKGFPERFEKEIKERVPESMRKIIDVTAIPERKYSVWNGASVLASIATFNPNWITRGEYDEMGPCIVHQKCK